MKKTRLLIICALITSLSHAMEKKKPIKPTKTIQKPKTQEAPQFRCPHCPVKLSDQKLLDLHTSSHPTFTIDRREFKEYIDTNLKNDNHRLDVDELLRRAAQKLAYEHAKPTTK